MSEQSTNDLSSRLRNVVKTADELARKHCGTMPELAKIYSTFREMLALSADEIDRLQGQTANAPGRYVCGCRVKGELILRSECPVHGKRTTEPERKA